MASKRDQSLKKAISLCRFCRKQIVSSQVGNSATPRADLFKPLKNKELTTQLGVTEVVLSNIVNELGRPSEKISVDDSLSNLSCLVCARSLVRSYAVIRKLLQSINLGLEFKSSSRQGDEELSSSLKRKSFGSPGSPSVKVLAKKTKDFEADLLPPSTERTEYLSAKRNILKDLTGATLGNENNSKENEEPFKETMQNDNIGERIHRNMDALACGQAKNNSKTTTKNLFSNKVNESKLAGVTKIIVCSPGGKCTVHESTGVEKTLARAIVFENGVTGANAALKMPSWKMPIVEGVGKLLQNEAIRYFKKSNLLKMTKGQSPINLCSLKIEDIENEFKEELPLTLALMESVAGVTKKRAKEARKKAKVGRVSKDNNTSALELRNKISSRNSITVAISMLLRQHFHNMSALLYRNTLLLMNGGCRALDIDRMSLQGILMSHSSGINMQLKMAKEFSRDIDQWKSDIAKKELMALLLTDIASTFDEGTDELTLNKVKELPSYDAIVWNEIKSKIENQMEKDAISHLSCIENTMKTLTDVREGMEDYRYVHSHCNLGHPDSL